MVNHFLRDLTVETRVPSGIEGDLAPVTLTEQGRLSLELEGSRRTTFNRPEGVNPVLWQLCSRDISADRLNQIIEKIRIFTDVSLTDHEIALFDSETFFIARKKTTVSILG